MTNKVKILKEAIKKNGFTYKLIKRDDRRAIYAQYDEGILIAYEVFKINLKTPPSFMNSSFEFHERFPSNEDFGLYAWTYKKLEDAKKKYDSLGKHT